MMVEYSPISFPRSFDRSQIKSPYLLALSLIPLCGCLIAILLGITKAFDYNDKSLHLVFPISNRQTLNDVLTVIGVFHALVGYCIRKLMSRVATQFRTRAFLDKSASTAQLLNTLPGSPDWKSVFRSRLARILFCAGLFSGGLSIGGGVLYKQGIVLSPFPIHRPATKHDQYFITNCTADFSVCVRNRYVAYGRALVQAKQKGLFTAGIEKRPDSDVRRLTFVSAPKLNRRELTGPTRNVTGINATSFAMVAEYQNVTPSQLPNDNRNWSQVNDGSRSIQLRFHGDDGIDWSFSFNHSNRIQTVRGVTKYCVVKCKWLKSYDSLLDSYHLNVDNCTSVRLGAWNKLSEREIAHAVFSDIRDQKLDDALESAYVVPAMYAAIVLAGLDGLAKGLFSDPLLNRSLTEPLNCSENFTRLAIESNKLFVAYIAFLSLIFIAHWFSGFVDTKAFVSEWAPVWFGLLSDSEQEDIRKQIRNNLGLEGVAEIGGDSESIPLNSIQRGLEEERMGL